MIFDIWRNRFPQIFGDTGFSWKPVGLGWGPDHEDIEVSLLTFSENIWMHILYM